MPKAYVYLAFPVNGEISALPVAEGQQVAKDAVLASLGKREPLEAGLSAAKLEVLAAQQALDTLNQKSDVAGKQAAVALQTAQKALVDAEEAYSKVDDTKYTDTLDEKEKAIQTAKDKLKDANDALDKVLNLDKDNQTRKDAQKLVDDDQREYDKAVRDRDLWKNSKTLAAAQVDHAKASLADVQREYDNRKGGPDKDQLALAQARLDNAKSAVKSAERAIGNMDLLAPFDGTLVDLNSLAIGQWVTAGRTVATLADFSQWYVETKDLTELEVVNVKEGQKVTVTPDALKDTVLTGEVVSIKKGYTERSGDVLYTVRVRLDKGSELLQWGMTVQVSFAE
jgi:multidrug resistance efflux pump